MISKTPNNIQVVEWQETTAKHDTEKAFYPIHQPGVYLYTTMDRRPLYVGRAENLEDRFDEHLSDNESNKDLKYHIHNQPLRLYYAIIPEENFRAGIEKFLFYYLVPAFNKNTPDASQEIAVNLPEGVNPR